MSDHAHAPSSGHVHAPASGGGAKGHTPSGGGAPIKMNGWVLFLCVIAFFFLLYNIQHRNDDKVTQANEKIEWEEEQEFDIPFNGEYGNFYSLGAYKQLQFAPATQPLDIIDNYGNPFHLDINENLGLKLAKNLPTDYSIKIKSRNCSDGKLVYATLRPKNSK